MGGRKLPVLTALYIHAVFEEATATEAQLTTLALEAYIFSFYVHLLIKILYTLEMERSQKHSTDKPQMFNVNLQENMKSIGIIKKYINRLPHYAKVEVDINTETNQIEVIEECCGEGWVRQGSIEEASSKGYKDWKQGAIDGVIFALKISGHQHKVRITSITGMATDTNPFIIFCAASYAVWDALEYEPDIDSKNKIDDILRNSWNKHR